MLVISVDKHYIYDSKSWALTIALFLPIKSMSVGKEFKKVTRSPLNAMDSFNQNVVLQNTVLGKPGVIVFSSRPHCTKKDVLY